MEDLYVFVAAYERSRSNRFIVGMRGDEQDSPVISAAIGDDESLLKPRTVSGKI
jgi:hypothetical protein